MQAAHFFFLGILIAAAVFGLWWLIIAAGLAALIARRSYIVLAVGVALDMSFAVLGGTFFHMGFYTVFFIVATMLIETVRRQLFWTS